MEAKLRGCRNLWTSRGGAACWRDLLTLHQVHKTLTCSVEKAPESISVNLSLSPAEASHCLRRPFSPSLPAPTPNRPLTLWETTGVPLHFTDPWHEGLPLSSKSGFCRGLRKTHFLDPNLGKEHYAIGFRDDENHTAPKRTPNQLLCLCKCKSVGLK